MFLAVLKNNQLNEHLTIFIQQPVARGAGVILQFTMILGKVIDLLHSS